MSWTIRALTPTAEENLRADMKADRRTATLTIITETPLTVKYQLRGIYAKFSSLVGSEEAKLAYKRKWEELTYGKDYEVLP